MMKGGQVKKAGLTSKVPVHMTMNGSVFNAKANTVSSQNARINNQVQTNQAGNVVRTNTAKSVSDIQNTQPAAKTERLKLNNKQQELTHRNENEKVDIGNYDFDNLTAVPDGELNDLKEELTELKDKNLPRFITNGIEKKLSKVNSEMQKRASNVAGGDKKEEVKNQEFSAKKGDQAQGEAESASNDAKAATAQTERGTSEMKDSASEMKSLDKKMKKDDKKFKKQMKAEEKAIQKISKRDEKTSC